MNRRTALQRVAILFGGAIIGADVFLSGCNNEPSKEGLSIFSENTIALLDEVGETILPTTSTSPGAKAAKIGEFMKTIVTDCYSKEDQKVFAEGISKLNDAAIKRYSKAFMKLAENEKHDLLVALDKAANDYNKNKKGNEPNHYFTMIKQLTLWGYFSSEVGATKALRYVEVPGKFEGCIPYKKRR